MAIKRIDHIAIVVEDLSAALEVYGEALGMSTSHIETIPDQDVKMAFLPSGESEIELLEPLHQESGIGRFLAKRGEGLHHICFEVEDIDATLADLKTRGIQLIDEMPKQGAQGRIAFIHPKGARGVLVELIERS
jgi:methylmalonyl-CoA/ethylmalonyl-CoA epimerase